ncbi:OVARIAN TUMOR DOMAIN-containing deubiquitinating enzyme 7 isoform X2 [Castanea sativa]|uniref:OVARIAN TUMOR DOMAIN-containing deubiquitinating enzyme 7 isoform X2 n=1 Tax=Castanea sativa TaxID=21020 RepID=UPI003F651D0A
MVKTKQHNSKPKKQPHVKKQGKPTDLSQFRAQLDALGLKIVHVTADGNCFFRALADQLEGNEEEHKKYRGMVVEYIMNMSPRWYIRNFDERGACMVHLSYHDEEHYNSVRLKEDPCDGPARPIIIKADADLSATAHQPIAATRRSKEGTGADDIHAGSIKMVMAGSGCENAEKVKQVLGQVYGDVDAAIEFLIAEQGAEEYPVQTDSLPDQVDTSYGNARVDENGNCEQHEEEPLERTCKQDASSSSVLSHDNRSSQPDDKVSKNKVCPCGSKKKYKACCGAATGRSVAKFVVNQSVDSRKGRKERKQGKKSGSAKATSTCGVDGGLPDMGALCI